MKCCECGNPSQVIENDKDGNLIFLCEACVEKSYQKENKPSSTKVLDLAVCIIYSNWEDTRQSKYPVMDRETAIQKIASGISEVIQEQVPKTQACSILIAQK